MSLTILNSKCLPKVYHLTTYVTEIRLISSLNKMHTQVHMVVISVSNIPIYIYTITFLIIPRTIYDLACTFSTSLQLQKYLIL